MSKRSEEFNFENQNGISLSGRLELPPDPFGQVAIFAHCFTCSKNTKAASRISRALCSRGMAVLRFDFTGLGGSGGDFASSHFSSNVADIVAAANALTERHAPPSLLVGHSLGGAAVLAAAPQLESVRAVATIGAPSDPAHVARLFAGDKAQIDADGRAQMVLAGRSFTINREFIDDFNSQSLADILPQLRKALLVFHAPLDDIVSIDHAGVIFQHAKHPKSFISLPGADHLLSKPEDAEYVADTLSAWSRRYLDRVQ